MAPFISSHPIGTFSAFNLLALCSGLGPATPTCDVATPGCGVAAPVRGVMLPGAGDFCVFVAGTAPSCGEGEKKGSSSEADDMLVTCPCWKKNGIWELVKSPGWEIYVNMIQYVDKLWIYIYTHNFYMYIEVQAIDNQQIDGRSC